MTLLSRLVEPVDDELKIAIHAFMAALAELDRGEVVKNKIVNEFELSVAEGNQLDEWITNINAGTITREEVHDALILGETRFYTKTRVRDRLGLTNN